MKARAGKPGPLLASLLLAVATACGDAGNDHAEGQGRVVGGPLLAMAEDGGQSIYAPKAEEWWASFGGLPICTEGPEVEVEKIRLTQGADPITVIGYVYVPGVGGGYGGLKGAPPDWRQSYADYSRAEDTGTYEELPAKVTAKCADYDPDEPWPNAVPVIKTGPEGVRSDGFWIDYSVGDREYTVKVPWEILLCGSGQPKGRCG